MPGAVRDSLPGVICHMSLAMTGSPELMPLEKPRVSERAAKRSSGLFVRTSSSAPSAAMPPKPVPLKKLKDSFLDGTSSSYLEELETRYQADPKSVDKTWAAFFRNLGEQTLDALVNNMDRGINHSMFIRFFS